MLVLAHAVFRAWALYGGWFYLDDFNLLRDALAEPLTLDSLLEPYNGHLMPGGRLLAEVVLASGGLDWTVAASLVLALQIAASAACWWMLSSLFGRSLGSVTLLLVYLTSALVVPALHWWTAAVNAVPLQLAMFLAVGAGARYLREGRLRWLLVTVLAVMVGLFFWEKAVLVLPLLGALAFGWYAEGGPLARLRTLLRTRWPAVVLGALLGAGYAAAYLALAEQVGGQAAEESNVGLVQNAVGTTFGTGVVGGPWRWADFPEPAVGVDPPLWATQSAWVLIAAVVAYSFLRRERTLRAWIMLGGYLAVVVGLTVWGRGGAFGELLGLQPRYLSDVLPVAVICAGLAYLPLQGAAGSSRPREEPLLTRPAPRSLVVGLVLLVAVGGVVSSARFARIWHTTNPTEPYVSNLRQDLAAYGSVDLADTAVAEGVVPALFAPANQLSTYADLWGDGRMRFPEATGQLATLAPDGGIRRAAIELGVRSERGPARRCGWTVTERGRYIPLVGAAFEWTWWVRVGYLASKASPVTVVAGDSEVTTEVQRGLHELFVQVEGAFDKVHILGLEDGATMCVDIVEVGQVVPGGAWE